VAVSSEEAPWLVVNHLSPKLNQKPDLFLTNAAFYLIDGAKTNDRRSQLPAAVPAELGARFAVGRPCQPFYSSISICDFKTKVSPAARGELMTHMELLWRALTPEQQHKPCNVRGALVHCRGVELFLNNGNRLHKVVQLVRFDAPGSAAAFREWMQPEDPLLRLFAEASAAAGVTVEPGRAFLGRGAEGTVLAVQHTASAQGFAMKLVTGNRPDASSKLKLQAEAALLAGDVAVQTVGDVFECDLGAAALLQPVGRPLRSHGTARWWETEASAISTDAFLSLLARLHTRNVCHGDARYPNVLFVNGKVCIVDRRALGLAHACVCLVRLQLLWIDFAQARVPGPEGRAADVRCLLSSLGHRDLAPATKAIDRYASNPSEEAAVAIAAALVGAPAAAGAAAAK